MTPSVEQTVKSFDSRLRLITPNVAIELGYNMYIADSRSPVTQLQQGAVRNIQEFEGLSSSFPEASAERIYLSTVRMAAIGFASGIARRKRTQQTRVAAADNEQELFLQSFKKGQRLVGWLSGSCKLLLLSGFVYYFAQMTLDAVGTDIRAIHHSATVTDTAPAIDPKYASLAVALAVTIIGSVAKSWWQERRVRRSTNRYKRSMREADGQYQEEVMSEYRLAAETASNAWLSLTGSRATTTSAFESLLIGVLTDGHEKAPTPAVAPVPKIQETEKLSNNLFQ